MRRHGIRRIALPRVGIALLALFISLRTAPAAPVAPATPAAVLAAPGSGPATAPAATASAIPAKDSTAGRPPGMAIAFSAVLQVEEPEKTAGFLIARAESLGGWFLRRGKTSVELRIPSVLADSFILGLDSLGVLTDRNLTSQNLEAEREDLLSRLKARKAVLQDYYAMLKESGDSTIFTIQNEIINLQVEIEQTTGQILKLEDRMALAQVNISFTFRERGAPLTTGRSRFPWLNRLNLPTLLERFDYEQRP